VEFISKDEAMRELREGLGAQSKLLNGLTENPLPASFEVVFKDARTSGADPEKIKERLEKTEGVEEVQYTEQWLERFRGLMLILKVSGYIIGGLLCVAVLFIVTNTIKLTIYSRRDEIEITKLVGGTDWFIKIPFLIEGAIQGIFSGLIALLILFLVYALFSLKSVQVLGLFVLDIVFLSGGYVIFIMALGLVLGVLGSLIALGRFYDYIELESYN
jgi:cell division transport system permease protein